MSEVDLSSSVIVRETNLSDIPSSLTFASSILHLLCFHLCRPQFSSTTPVSWHLRWMVNPEFKLRHFPLQPHKPPPPPLPPCLSGVLSIGEHRLDFPEGCIGHVDATAILFFFSPSRSLAPLLLPASLITCLQLYTSITLLLTQFKTALSHHIDSLRRLKWMLILVNDWMCQGAQL